MTKVLPIANTSHRSEVLNDESSDENVKNENHPQNIHQTATNIRITVQSLETDNNNEEQESTDESYELEGITHKRKVFERKELFTRIILNDSVTFSWKEFLLYTFGIVFIALLSTFPLNLIPLHDVVQSPEYWYEVLLIVAVAGSLGFIMRTYEVSYYLNMETLRKTKNISVMFLLGLAMNVAGVIVAFYLWTEIYGLVFPIPFLGLIRNYAETIIFIMIIWFNFPKLWRKESQLQKGITYYILFVLVFEVMVNLNQVTIVMIQNVEEQYQPLVCLALPVEREFFIWVFSKLLKKCANHDRASAEIIMKYVVSAKYATVVCAFIGYFATNQTSWVLMGFDCSLNMFQCLRLVYLRKTNPENVAAHIEVAQDMALNEIAEFHTPLVYALVVGITYYGPNGHIFGSILNSYWRFQAIDDIDRALKIMLLFFVVELFGALATTMILFLSCKIHFWKVFTALQKEFGGVFAVILARQLTLVSNI